MSTNIILILAGVLAGLVLVSLFVLWRSIKKGGRLAAKVGETAAKSGRVQKFAANQIGKTDLDPDLIEKIAIQQGVDPAQAQAAATAFAQLTPDQQQQAVRVAQGAVAKGGDPNAMTQAAAQVRAMTAGPSATAPRPNRTKTRAKRKQAKSSRKKNR